FRPECFQRSFAHHFTSSRVYLETTLQDYGLTSAPKRMLLQRNSSKKEPLTISVTHVQRPFRNGRPREWPTKHCGPLRRVPFAARHLDIESSDQRSEKGAPRRIPRTLPFFFRRYNAVTVKSDQSQSDFLSAEASVLERSGVFRKELGLVDLALTQILFI